MLTDAENRQKLTQLTQPLNAMHIAQLTAFAFGLPPLYFCRDYLALDEATAIDKCNERLIKLLNTEEISLPRLNDLLSDKEYFDEEEARLRVTGLTTD